MTNWIFNFVVSLTFLPLIDALGRSRRLLALRRRSALVTLWFCWKFVPETKGKRLEEIQEIFRERAGEKT